MAYPSSAWAGQGTLLQRGDGASPENFTTVAEIKTVKKTGSKADIVDVTNMDSTGAYREKLAVLVDAGDIDFDANYIPTDATQAGLQTDFDSRTKRNWKIVLPNSLGHWAFAAFLSAFDFDVQFDKPATCTGKLTITGKPVFTTP